MKILFFVSAISTAALAGSFNGGNLSSVGNSFERAAADTKTAITPSSRAEIILADRMAP